MSEQVAAAGINVAGQTANTLISASESRRARKWQEEMWNKANEYNRPVNQVARLKEAGINPNLAFGSAASTMASPLPSSPARAQGYFDGGEIARSYFMTKLERESVLSQIRERNAATHQQELQNRAFETMLDDYIQSKVMGYRADTAKSSWFLNNNDEWYNTQMMGRQFQNDLYRANAALAEAQKDLTREKVRLAIQDFQHLVNKYGFEDSYYSRKLNPYETSTVAGLVRSINGAAANVAEDPVKALRQLEKGFFLIGPSGWLSRRIYDYYRR